jgi:L-ascorbate metabolism protein UlaG (beta-lactamase superfamily)
MKACPSFLSVTTALLLGALGRCGLTSAQEAPRFAPSPRLSSREMLLQFNASNSSICRLEFSTNLLEWDRMVTLLSTGANQHLDGAAPYQERRYYVARQLAGTDHLTGDHLATANGEVVIHPINHATFVMGWNSQMIYLDPVGGATPFANLPRADLVLITHSHGDHFHPQTLTNVLGAGAIILAPQAVYNSMSTTLRALTKVMVNGSSTNVLGLLVEAVPAYGPNHTQGAGNGYVLTLGGRRIYVSGDTGNTPEMRALPNVDMAFVCMNTPYTMTVTDAAAAVRVFRPRVVYPIHYRNGDGTYSDLNAFKALVGTDLGIEVRLRKWY